jgi:hypothetical protein
MAFSANAQRSLSPVSWGKLGVNHRMIARYGLSTNRECPSQVPEGKGSEPEAKNHRYKQTMIDNAVLSIPIQFRYQ